VQWVFFVRQLLNLVSDCLIADVFDVIIFFS